MIKIKSFFSFKQNKFFWLNIIAMIFVIVVSVLGALWGIDIYTRHGESYVVPNIKYKTIDEAQNLLKQQHMQGVVIDSSYVKTQRPGIILDQTPIGGMRVKEGRIIYLTINTTQIPLITIPNIIDNSSVRQAVAKLKAMGFKLTEPEIVPGEQDWVYGIKYKGKNLKTGDKVPNEALLTLCVGKVYMRDSLAMEPLIVTDTTKEEEAQVDPSWF